MHYEKMNFGQYSHSISLKTRLSLRMQRFFFNKNNLATVSRTGSQSAARGPHRPVGRISAAPV